MDGQFAARYEAFSKYQRTGEGAPLGEPIRPVRIRVQFDQAICEALGVPVSEEELKEVYAAIVQEMVVIRGLQRD